MDYCVSLPANTTESNRRQWNDKYAWPKQGDEWSERWGGAEPHWAHFLFPRVRQFLPAHTILEIAPGHGRWTQFLVDWCEHLIVVDLSPACIDYCKQRFADRTNISYFSNDGRSLDMIQDRSLDFVFSSDSLVHADAQTIESYIRQLHRKLQNGASAFIHHSNAGSYRALLEGSAWLADRNIPRLSSFVKKHTDSCWRALDMSAKRMVEFCRNSSMSCVSQELYASETEHETHVLWPIDCISILRNSPSEMITVPVRIDYGGLARKCKSRSS
jgi:2-polyprenyl-3-methyl-5-hydroxy-6-metoxy-1,4-benzoquinol methylase